MGRLSKSPFLKDKTLIKLSVKKGFSFSVRILSIEHLDLDSAALAGGNALINWPRLFNRLSANHLSTTA